MLNPFYLSMRIQFVVVLLIFIIPVSCKQTANPMPEGDYVRLVQCSARLMVLTQEGRASGWDSTATERKRDSLFASYGYREKDFLRTIGDFGSESETWRQFYADLVKELESMQKQQTDTPGKGK